MEWKTSKEPVPYEQALQGMDRRVADIQAGRADDLGWLLEHPPLYTAGTSARDSGLLNPQFPVYKTGRGGQYTYHGPGQRVAYVMLDLKKHAARCLPRESGDLVRSGKDSRFRGKSKNLIAQPDIRQYVWSLEEWIIKTLQEFDIKGERREGRVGIWVDMPEGEKKIAAIGVRVRHWITLHGVSINVSPDLLHYQGIIPCGISEHGVTSMKALGADVSMEELDQVLKASWAEVFEAQKKAA